MEATAKPLTLENNKIVRFDLEKANKEILRLALAGCPEEAIAKRLRISPQYVQSVIQTPMCPKCTARFEHEYEYEILKAEWMYCPERWVLAVRHLNGECEYVGGLREEQYASLSRQEYWHYKKWRDSDSAAQMFIELEQQGVDQMTANRIVFEPLRWRLAEAAKELSAEHHTT